MLKNRTRLRVEMLEGREVPALAVGSGEIVDPPNLDAPDEVVTDTCVTDEVVTDTCVTDEDVTDTDVTDYLIMISNVLAETSPIPEVDLAAFVKADKANPSVGDLVDFKITVENNGPLPATNVALTTTLPEGVTFVSATPGQGAYDKVTGIWTVGTVQPAGSITLTLKVKVLETTEQTVWAAITHSDMSDPVVDNNSASNTVTPALAGIKLTKTASSSTLVVGATVVFTISVKNTGPGMARAINIKDTLGAGFTFVEALLPTRGVFTAGTRTWKIGALTSGSTATVKLIATVKSTGRLTSTVAIVSGTGIDELRSNREAKATVTGTKVSTPATWSYVVLGSRPKLLPVTAGAVPPSLQVNAPATGLKPTYLRPLFGL
ncbi:MAG: DUF11 domain-containing protein [Gemmataceae bacterium]|nr:DUF11 domain-containing protein [Gemmataceae bacterium]